MFGIFKHVESKHQNFELNEAISDSDFLGKTVYVHIFVVIYYYKYILLNIVCCWMLRNKI